MPNKALPMTKEEPSGALHGFAPYQSNENKSDAVNPSGADSFCLDEFTGDVHHIQTSLDNIRDLMFDKLSDSSTTIDDLFGVENVLLSPSLPTTSNILVDEKPWPSKAIHQTNSDKLLPDVNNQLLEQLIHETARIEGQQQAQNQFERDKLNLHS
jgi:hypothetical protein